MLAERGFGGIGLTAHEVDAWQPRKLRQLLGEHGLQATSLNSAGYVLHSDPAAARSQADYDARLFASAAELGAPVNFIPGGLLQAASGTGLLEARARAADGLARLAERARIEGVRLALEPFHPMAIGPRGCINQISAALAAIKPFPWVGLTLDLHHSWWDADLEDLMSRHAQRVMLIQICGIELPPDGSAPRRAELGAAGTQEVRHLLRLATEAGHAGGIEYEVFHDQLGAPNIEDLLNRAATDLLALTE
jgi:sugar phosphate isomerase/epimerase